MIQPFQSWYLFKRNKCIYSHKGFNTNVPQHFMFSIPNVHQSMNGWTNCGISIKQNTTQLYNSELLIYVATWPHLQIIMVDKRESKDTCYVIPHIWKCRQCKLICRSESRLILPGQRKRGSERDQITKAQEACFRMTERFIILVFYKCRHQKNTIIHLNKCNVSYLNMGFPE